jgi:hypothetical protein
MAWCLVKAQGQLYLLPFTSNSCDMNVKGQDVLTFKYAANIRSVCQLKPDRLSSTPSCSFAKILHTFFILAVHAICSDYNILRDLIILTSTRTNLYKPNQSSYLFDDPLKCTKNNEVSKLSPAEHIPRPWYINRIFLSKENQGSLFLGEVTPFHFQTKCSYLCDSGCSFISCILGKN